MEAFKKVVLFARTHMLAFVGSLVVSVGAALCTLLYLGEPHLAPETLATTGLVAQVSAVVYWTLWFWRSRSK